MDSPMLDAAIYAADTLNIPVLPLMTRSKEPSTEHGVNDATTDLKVIRGYYSAHPDRNLGFAMGGGLIAIDIDVDDEAGYDGYETLRAWELEHGELPETISTITGRGGCHLIYRVDKPIKNAVNEDLHIDIRSDGGYIMAPPSVHPNGRRVEWENDPEDYAIADADENVYAFIEFIAPQKQARKFRIPKEIKAGKRNDTLYRYGCSLRALGQDDDMVAAAIAGMNYAKCHPPLTDDEVEKITESVLSLPPGMSEEIVEARKANVSPFRKLSANGKPTGAVKHNLVGRELIDNHKACFVDGAPAVYTGKRYASGWSEIDRAIRDLIDDCRTADQREIRAYISDKAPKVKASSPCLIAFNNGVLDIDYGFMDYTDDMVITNIIPHDYDESAYSEVADRTLDRISCGDPIVRKNLEEIIGMCMYRSNEFGQCPVLIGSGSNGKSTYIKALRSMLGDENVSALDVNILGKSFQAGRLLGKLANLGDDISNERLNGDVLATFKKVVTGEWIYTDVKNSQGFEFKPYCTLVISCNEFPSLGDSSEGMMRRLFPIPFDAQFTQQDPEYDPRLSDKLSTEEVAQYLINIGLKGLQRVRYNRGLTPNARSEEMVESMRQDNSTVLQWIDDRGMTDIDFVGSVIAEVYERYRVWCDGAGQHPYKRRKFTEKICEKFALRSVPTHRDSVDGMRSVRVFGRK